MLQFDTQQLQMDILQQVLENSPQSVAVFDNQVRYIAANKKWAEHYGLQNRNIIGLSHYEIFPEVPQRWRDIHQRCLQGEVLTADADPFVRLDGSLAYIKWEVRPWYTPSETVGGLIMYTEVVTEKIDTHNQLRRSQAQLKETIEELRVTTALAEENARLKTQFLATISHEMRTPMNAIIGFTGVILNQIGGAEFNEKTRKYVTRIESNSKRLLNLINDLLDLSRIEAGQLELQQQTFELKPLAQHWHDSMYTSASDNHLQFHLIFDDTLPQRLYGDPAALTQIVNNLLSNAIKFTHPNGIVELHITHLPRSQQWRIAVTDTGIGIPAYAHQLIFDAFRQVDQNPNREYEGTGLGLAIVQKLVHAMDGDITLNSTVDEGSVFTVTLPIHDGV